MKKMKPLFSNTPLTRTVDVMDAQRAMKYFWTSSLLGMLALCLAILNSPAQATDRPDSFADLAERLSPAVVNISTSMVVRMVAGLTCRVFPKAHPLKIFSRNLKIEARHGVPSHWVPALLLIAAGLW